MPNNNIEQLFKDSLHDLDLTDKQQTVLQASLTLFSTKGFDRTSTHDIATMAGVSEGTVYKQFKTKIGILNAILGPFIEQVIPRATHEFAKDLGQEHYQTLADFLTFLISNRMRFVVDNRRQLKILIQELFRDPQLLTNLSNEITTVISPGMTGPFERLQQDGLLVDWPISRIVRYIVSTVFSYIIPITLELDPTTDINAYTSEAVEFLSRGLAPNN